MFKVESDSVIFEYYLKLHLQNIIAAVFFAFLHSIFYSFPSSFIFLEPCETTTRAGTAQRLGQVSK